MSDPVRRLAGSFRSRAREFIGVLENQIATTSGRQAGVIEVLRTLKSNVEVALDRVDEELQDADTDPDDLEGLIAALLQRLKEWIRDHDAHFARQSRDLSPAITYFLDQQIKAWDVPEATVIVTVGEPHNFMCGQPSIGMASSSSRRDVLAISVPRIEGNRIGWLPITLGHEWAHYLLQKNDLEALAALEQQVEQEIDEALEEGLLKSDTLVPRPSEMGEIRNSFGGSITVKKISLQWIQEIVCDAYAVATYGPAGYAAMVEFLSALGEPEAIGERSHPPAAYRAKLMREWLDDLGRSLTDNEVDLVERFGDVPTRQMVDVGDEWASVLLEIVDHISSPLWVAVKAWVSARAYIAVADPAKVMALKDRIIQGITPTEAFLAGNLTMAVPAEIVNAAWHANYEAIETKFTEDPYPVGRLAMKAIDDVHFIESWERAGGSRMSDQPLGQRVPDGMQLGVLAHSELRARVNSGDPESQIVMTPLMNNAFGNSSVDIRLGNQFIVFDRSSSGAYDSFAGDAPDPRSMQHRIGRAWGEVFYLHPNQLVLAAALEYLVMPEDLSAQVITRSSLGRLGLISATAVQVHPGYHGCLTLELVNLGEMPVAITPGERIAQLMFFPTMGGVRQREAGEDEKYEFPVGPEFSKGRRDREWGVLNSMRRSHHGVGRHA